jgi:hypothetical protein
MKAIELIERAIMETHEDDVKKLLQDFLRANTVAKNEKFDIFKYISKNDNMRPCFSGVLHENGYKVASDTDILCVIKSEYDSDFEGKIITQKGEIVDASYPNYRLVMPSNMDEFTPFGFDYGDTLQKIKEAERVAKTERSDVYVYLKIGNENVYVLSKYFVKFMQFIKYFISDVKITFNKRYLYANSGDNICMLGTCMNCHSNYQVDIKVFEDLTKKLKL